MIIRRKSLRCIVSCLLIAVIAFSLPASAVSANSSRSSDVYIKNADFELGTSEGWNLNSGSSVVAEGRGNSGYALRVAGSQWSGVSQSISVEPNTDYSLTGWVKRVSGTGAHYLYAKSGSGGGLEVINGSKQWFTYMSSDWVMHRWEFNSGSNTQITLHMIIEDEKSVFLYDDIKLEKLKPASFDGYIYNGDFEMGTSPGAWQLNESYSIVEGGYNGSDYALYVEGTAWSNANQAITVETNTDYRLSAWVKRVKGTGAHRISAKANGEELTVLNGSKMWFKYTDTDWVQHTWEFNSGSNTKITVYLTVEDENSVFMYDNVSIEKLAVASFDGYLVNGDFETGNTSGWILSDDSSAVTEGGHGGSRYAVKFVGKSGANINQTVRVEGMTDYRLSLYAKRISGTGDQRVIAKSADAELEAINGTDTVIPRSRNWTKHIYEFNSGRNTELTLYLEALKGSSTFIYDSIVIEEIVKPDYSDTAKGDISLNGKVEAEDAELMEKHLSGAQLLEGAAAYAADLDYNDVITEADKVLLEKLLSISASQAVPLSPIKGKTVALPSWQVDELMTKYIPGKSDKFSGVAYRVDTYMRDPIELKWAFAGEYESFTVLVADNAGLENARSYTVSEPSLVIDNLIPDKNYYWAVSVGDVVSETASFHTADTVRTITVEGVSNTRDIGGWLTADGKRVKYGIGYRGANFDEITEKGKKAILEDIGLKTEVDLRNHGEGVKYPLGDKVNFLLAGQWGGAMYANDQNTSLHYIGSDYVNATVNALRTFADESNYPIYFHCSYGRDRTGTMAFLLLGLLGVERIDIQKDFELTFLAEFSGGGISAAGPLKALNETIDWVKRNYAPGGSIKEAVEAYLLDAGLTAQEIASIRANMLEEVPEDIMKGDLDYDGKITVADALVALRIAAKLAESNEDILKIGDIDADGSVTVADALAILRVAAKMADSL